MGDVGGRFSQFPKHLNTHIQCDPDTFMDFEERAAIMEYDGGLTREEAEKIAFAIVIEGKKDASL